MGIKDCFEEVICFETLNSLTNNFNNSKPIVCKPSMEAFKRAIEIAKVDADKIVCICVVHVLKPWTSTYRHMQRIKQMHALLI